MRPIGSRPLFVLAVLAALSLPSAAHAQHPPPPPPGQLQITAQPALFPGFNRAVPDYVTRCSGNQPVQVTVREPTDTSVVVDGRAVPTGTSTTPVSIGFNQAFTISVTAGGTTTRHDVRCLPSDFVQWTFNRTAGAHGQAEFYIVTPTVPNGQPPYIVIYDGNGVPVWWWRGPTPIDGKLLANGNLAWTQWRGTGFGSAPGATYEERRVNGSLVRALATVGVPTDFHDFQRLSNGNYLLLAYRPRDGVDLRPIGGPANATVLDGEIQELTPAGSLVWSWNSKDHIALSETGRWSSETGRLPDGRTAYDLVHINSVEPNGDGLIVSLRHLDAVIRIRRSTGALDWKLGGTNRPESLSVVGDPSGGPTTLGGQHDARVYGDGTITIYDNGTGLQRPPRAVRYRINTSLRTATFVERVTDSGAPSSVCCGGTRKVAGGNYVTSWASNSLVTESTPAGTRVFSLTFGNGLFSYRAFPVPYGRLTRTALRAGMNTMNPR